MNFATGSSSLPDDTRAAIADGAVRQIPPLWPLDAQVAVNPYLGQSDRRLAETGALLERIGGGPVTMPRQWYVDRISDGSICEADLAGALAASPYASKPTDVAALRHAAAATRPPARPLPTIADLAAAHSGIDWPGVIGDRIGAWASSYFDAGQALWSAPQGKSAWSAFRMYATHDLTPEIVGLRGFAAFVNEAPDTPSAAIERAVRGLGLEDAALPTYFHQLLLDLGGWAQFGRFRQWTAERSGHADPVPIDLLAIRLIWDEALHRQYRSAIEREWPRVRGEHAKATAPSKANVVDEILQESAERASQRRLAEALAAPCEAISASRPPLQVAFCIDVRSEIMRRALETVDPRIRTLGFAGFFGIATGHRRFASDAAELRLPVLLNPAVCSSAGGLAEAAAGARARVHARARRAWGRFKLAAVSSFAFVEATGPVYAGKLIRDVLGLHRPLRDSEPAPQMHPPLDPSARIRLAETILRAMSLTDGFAPIVVLAGHGARVVNNPHSSGLQCGACGGHSGEVNARLLARLLNDGAVRKGLAQAGIAIPEDTLFIGALHDTTADEITLYDGDANRPVHRKDLDRVRAWFAAAGAFARTERALRLPGAARGRDLADRGRNWAEVRPEWGLAGCTAFIAAPRTRTAGRNLGGRVFLHEYDWRADRTNGFPVLELVLTAPVVVASWISLQYYGSTIAPEVFGAGNKLLHNVVGGIGVLEGNGGKLRPGLPLQSLHDGARWVHEPLRLTVCIEAPRDALTEVLKSHPEVRTLFDHRWLHLFAMDEDGQMAWRYVGDLAWAAEVGSVGQRSLEAVP